MNRSLLFLYILLFASFRPGGNSYKSPLEGKRISETPFGKYLTDTLPGHTLLLFVSYGCSHCEIAAVETKKLISRIDRILVLGSGTENEKEIFKKNTGLNCPMYDYDFSFMRGQLLAEDKKFPPPPSILWIKDNTLKKVFLHAPTEAAFDKMKKKCGDSRATR
jgi:hypothetical protein